MRVRCLTVFAACVVCWVSLVGGGVAVAANSLPDGRAYELVSTYNKQGGDVYPVDNLGPAGSDMLPYPLTQVSVSGESVAFPGDPDTGGNGKDGNMFLASRGAGGWAGGDITPLFSAYPPPTYQVFSSDLSTAIVRASSPQLSANAPVGYENLYRRDNATGAYEPLVASTPPNTSAEGFSIKFAGASSDLSHVIFSADDALTPEATVGGTNLYEWVEGTLHLVNVYPNGTSEPYASFLAADPSDGQAYFNNEVDDSISSDGSRIFWEGADGNLYVREDARTTVQIPGGHFEAASSDGSSVVVSSGGGLGEYDVDSRQLTEIAPPGSGVASVYGLSGDGSYVYFIAEGALAAGATPSACEECNLYVWHGGVTTFIAKLGYGDLSRELHQNAVTIAQVTPDGKTLAFVSSNNPTGYDNTCAATAQKCTKAEECGGPVRKCAEVYLYHVDTGQLVCASCDPSGAPPVREAIIPGSMTRNENVHLLSDDGSRIFFDSPDALVPSDTNGRFDVYEYEQAGAGSCQSAPGCVYLISGGRAEEDTWVSGASANGDDVFFVTREALVSQDGDENDDMYDARVGGGFAVGGVAAPACVGESCKAPPAQSPVFGAPASTAIVGAGNVVAVPVTVAVTPKKKPVKKRPAQRKRRAGRRRGKSGKKTKQGTHKASKTSKGRK
jgi:hypothetical protein